MEVLVGECSLYANYLVQSSFLFDVGTVFPHPGADPASNGGVFSNNW